jgi:hypothetical protein
MYRRSGIVLLLVTIGVSVWMLVTPVRHFTGYLLGVDRPQELYTQCGTAVSILSGRFDPGVTTPGTRNDCVMEARGRIFYLVAADTPLLVAAVVALARGRYPNLPLHSRS